MIYTGSQFDKYLSDLHRKSPTDYVCSFPGRGTNLHGLSKLGFGIHSPEFIFEVSEKQNSVSVKDSFADFRLLQLNREGRKSDLYSHEWGQVGVEPVLTVRMSASWQGKHFHSAKKSNYCLKLACISFMFWQFRIWLNLGKKRYVKKKITFLLGLEFSTIWNFSLDRDFMDMLRNKYRGSRSRPLCLILCFGINCLFG